ncbi:purine catabolism regulatory protein [Clostridiales bacterium S5-A14a]|nr:purine catabolism regulatory protein [Clostridiales bacterium S5-A14a]
MKVTIDDCLEINSLSKSQVLSGSSQGYRRVTSVSVMDGTTLDSILAENGKPNQLVLTSFQGNDGDPMDEELQIKVVRALAAAKIAGIAVFWRNGNLFLQDKTVEVARELDMPLLCVKDDNGEDIRYSDVIEGVMDKLLYGDNFRNDLITKTIFHLLNFEKYSNFQTALKEAAISNDFQVILLSKDFNPILTVETRHQTTIEEAIKLGKERDVEKSGIYTFINVNGVLTYWGPISIDGQKHFIFIVDNDDNYSAGEITKLAEIIEIAMGMWKFTPERDAKADLIKALMRGNLSLASSLRNELEIDDKSIISVFQSKGIDLAHANQLMYEMESRHGFEILRIASDGEIYGVILKGDDLDIDEENGSYKALCLDLYSKMKEGSKAVRIFHSTGIEGIEGAVSGYRLINENWMFVEYVFPYKRVFTKYDMTLVSSCTSIRMQNGNLKETFMNLLDPFNRELGSNKAKQLLDTLETFVLDAGLNSSMTAKFMGIHTNTVQYRLKRINEVLGAEITGNRVIPALTIALALKRLEIAEG